MTDRNVWGTRKADVGEGYCPECEREGGRHYAICPFYVPFRQAAQQCECGTYWCTTDHNADAALAAQAPAV